MSNTFDLLSKCRCSRLRGKVECICRCSWHLALAEEDQKMERTAFVAVEAKTHGDGVMEMSFFFFTKNMVFSFGRTS